jgi:hypothetical protein
MKRRGLKAADYLEHHSDLSNSVVAAELGVSEATVRRARREGVTEVTPERVIGLDGKSYPARRA